MPTRSDTYGRAVPRQGTDGRWRCSVYNDGTRHTFTARTYRECEERRDAFKDAQKRGSGPLLGRKSLTVGEYLAEWLAVVATEKDPRTAEGYGSIVRHHLAPAFGKQRLARLTPDLIERYYARLRREPNPRTGRPAAPRTIQHIHACLHTALARAVRWRLLPSNPASASLLDAPKAPKGKAQDRVLTAVQARTLLAGANDTPNGALVVLALSTAMRQGELLGLRWQDVDLDAGIVRIAQAQKRDRGKRYMGTPKWDSARVVPLIAPAVEALIVHRTRQHEAGLITPLVFCTRVGTPLQASNFYRREYQPLLARLGLPPVTFHSLRHATATLLLEAGVPLAVVQQILGHTRIATTVDVYGHVGADAMRAGMAVLERVYRPDSEAR